MKLDVYWMPTCSTCKKAVDYLNENGVEIALFRDMKSETLSKAEVKKLVELVGGAEGLFSKRAIKYRTMKLNERTLSDEEMIDLMTGEYTFIKRPVIVSDGRAIAGFSVKRYEAFLNE